MTTQGRIFFIRSYHQLYRRIFNYRINYYGAYNRDELSLTARKIKLDVIGHSYPFRRLSPSVKQSCRFIWTTPYVYPLPPGLFPDHLILNPDS